MATCEPGTLGIAQELSDQPVPLTGLHNVVWDWRAGVKVEAWAQAGIHRVPQVMNWFQKKTLEWKVCNNIQA